MRARSLYQHYTSSKRGTSKVKIFIALSDFNQYVSAVTLWEWCCISLNDLQSLLTHYTKIRYLRRRQSKNMYGSRIWLYRLTAKGKWWLFHRPGPGKPLKGGAAFNLDRVRSNMKRFHADVVEIEKKIEWPIIISRYQKITKIEEMMEALKPWEKREVTNAKGGV